MGGCRRRVSISAREWIDFRNCKLSLDKLTDCPVVAHCLLADLLICRWFIEMCTPPTIPLLHPLLCNLHYHRSMGINDSHRTKWYLLQWIRLCCIPNRIHLIIRSYTLKIDPNNSLKTKIPSSCSSARNFFPHPQQMCLHFANK